MTITNQTNPVGTEYTSSKSKISVPREGNILIKETTFTTLRLTKTTNNPPTYSIFAPFTSASVTMSYSTTNDGTFATYKDPTRTHFAWTPPPEIESSVGSAAETVSKISGKKRKRGKRGRK